MSFVIQKVSGRKISLAEFRTAVLRIGRGTNAELRSDNPAVSLEHAIIESESGGYTITDKGSITGTYLNGKPVESSRLAKGDVIEIGDLRIEVQVAEPKKPLFLRTVTRERIDAGAGAVEEDEPATPRPAAGEGPAVRAEKVDYAGSFRLHRPWLTKTSVAAVAAIITLAVIAEVTRPQKQTAFMPGGVSSAHAKARDAEGNSIAENCSACHQPWRSVTDKRCEACHKRVGHAENEIGTPACMACHSEHRGLPKLALIGDSKCTACHADLPAHTKGPPPGEEIRSITEFGRNHPAFTVPADPNNIRFNHSVHLKAGGVFNATGRREVLQCQDCHKLVVTRGKADPVALQFEEHCQRCHRLTFDARFPTAEIPHGGDAQLAYGYIATTYAGNREILNQSPEEVRRLLSQRNVSDLGERALINASQVIRAKCGKCHELKQTLRERFAVAPPVILTRWLEGARFTHTAHSGLPCESCHRGMLESTRTADVHIPNQQDCTSCHARGASAASTCVTCHEYHVRSKPVLSAAAVAVAGGAVGEGGETTRMLDTILLILIIALLLVVLVPVGIALFQRIRPILVERVAQKQPRPASPPPPQSAGAPVPPAPAAQAPAARAPEPAQPATPSTPSQTSPFEATRFAPPADAGATPAGGVTEFIEWYGMLLCTSGPLEGQRFLIEEDGLYIGRDATMAQVVINDGRVSKRHVRIVPRGGRVWAIDQGSTNGTFMGKPPQRITEAQLKRGDTIVLAENAASFLYQI